MVQKIYIGVQITNPPKIVWYVLVYLILILHNIACIAKLILFIFNFLLYMYIYKMYAENDFLSFFIYYRFFNFLFCFFIFCFLFCISLLFFVLFLFCICLLFFVLYMPFVFCFVLIFFLKKQTRISQDLVT